MDMTSNNIIDDPASDKFSISSSSNVYNSSHKNGNENDKLNQTTEDDFYDVNSFYTTNDISLTDNATSLWKTQLFDSDDEFDNMTLTSYLTANSAFPSISKANIKASTTATNNYNFEESERNNQSTNSITNSNIDIASKTVNEKIFNVPSTNSTDIDDIEFYDTIIYDDSKKSSYSHQNQTETTTTSNKSDSNAHQETTTTKKSFLSFFNDIADFSLKFQQIRQKFNHAPESQNTSLPQFSSPAGVDNDMNRKSSVDYTCLSTNYDKVSYLKLPYIRLLLYGY